MAKEKTTANCPVMYLGPSLRGSRHVTHGTVFREGRLLPHLEKEVAADADFAALFVPVSLVGKARAELKNPVSPLAHSARRVAEKG